MLLNGVLAHGLDYDDTHMAGVIHLSVSVLPAVLGVAASRGRAGRTADRLCCRRSKSGARIASVARGGLHAQGFHPTGVVGTFASALACGRLLGLDAGAAGRVRRASRCRWPAAACSSSRTAPGPSASTPAGRPRPAITAAQLAGHDIPAPQAPYTGRYGFTRPISASAGRGIDLSLGTAGLGRRPAASLGAGEHRGQAVPDVPLRPCQRRCRDRAASRGLRRRGGSRRSKCWCRPARCRWSASRWRPSAGRAATTRPSSACRTRWRAACCAAGSA